MCKKYANPNPGTPRRGSGFVRTNARWLSAGGLLTLTSAFGQTYFIALFSGEIRAEFGLSHGDWGAIYAAGTMVSAALMIWTGGLVDRFRVRDMATVTLLGLALACLAMAALPSVWALPFVILALRLCGQGMCTHLAATGMARWFAANRGRALSIATIGFSVGEALLPILFVSLLTVAPWRSLWVLSAIMALCSLVLVRFLLVKERRPGGVNDTSQTPGLMGNRHWTRANALRHPLIWTLMPVVLGAPCFVTAMFFHQVHLSDAKGFTHVQFVAFLPLYTACVIATVLTVGGLIDRFGARRLLALTQLPFVAGFLVMGLGTSLASLGVAMMLVGMGAGCMTTVPTACWAEAYGTRHIGAIKALATSVMVLGSALGPAITGAAIDAGMPLPAQMPFFALWFVGAGLLAGWAARHYIR